MQQDLMSNIGVFRYHLEQVGIIQQRRLLLEGLSDEIMNRLIAEVEIRLRNKYSELENMKSWIQVKGVDVNIAATVRL